MSDFSEFVNPNVTRRDFVATAAAAASFCLLNCGASAGPVAPANIVKALYDKNIVHGMVTVGNGGSEIDAYLSRPRKKGRFPAVIVIP